VRSPVTKSRSYSSTSLVSSAADELRGRHEHLAAEMAAFLLRRELILVVHAARTCLDHRAHQLIRVERPTEAGLRIGEDRRVPVRPVATLRPVDLIRTLQRVVQPLHELRRAVCGIEALIGIRLAGTVRVGRHLPAGEVDRLEARLHHLHRLAAGHRAERAHRLLALQQLPQPLGAVARERVLGNHGAAKPYRIGSAVCPPDPGPAGIVAPARLELVCLCLDTSVRCH
jgi:hypothetical protein